ncbi:hypothetical protein HPP92_001535 [Vanilla planifolia]|uniref:Pentatricopeptide repeat-containing protein n=1 Tax=Vanilla planifolia TaxID=51239 RepID=A0A835RWF4_VANPL|nr:hypothetical protein HPP92_001535 [Vanilla planifolia]
MPTTILPSLPFPNFLSFSAHGSLETHVRVHVVSTVLWDERRRSGVVRSSIPKVYSHGTVDYERRRSGGVRISIPKVYSHGTVDYERRPVLKWSTLYRRISMMEECGAGSSAELERWENEEQQLSKWELFRVIKELRKFGRYKRALEACYLIQFFFLGPYFSSSNFHIYHWMASQGDRFSLSSSDMAIQVDLIAKVHGILHAEEYFHKLPEMWKDRRTYGALLHSYAMAKMKEKAEVTLEAMKAEGCANHTLPFNVIMSLYLTLKDHDKVSSTIKEMKERNIFFDLYSYNIWITNCGALGDLQEMERVTQELIANTRLYADWTIYTTLATMYTRFGEIEKAQTCLKDAELRIAGRDRTPFNFLLGLYSSTGTKDDVYRIWRRYKSNYRILNSGYRIMLHSLIKLGDIEGAEQIYEEWLSSTSNLDPKVSYAIISGYIKEGRVDDARDILNGLIARGGKPKPVSWEILADGYIQVNRISEALSCMVTAASYEDLGGWRPKVTTVENILNLCGEHDEKKSVQVLVDVLRRTGCLEMEEYNSLLSKLDYLPLPGGIGKV